MNGIYSYKRSIYYNFIFRSTFCLFFSFLTHFSVLTQNEQKISGIVLLSNNVDDLLGTSISVKGKRGGATPESKGYYSMNVRLHATHCIYKRWLQFYG